MNASKEQAAKARTEAELVARGLDRLRDTHPELVNELKRRLLRIDNFLERAQAKLPSEATYERDKAK